jgi:hypothetical protein
MKRTKYRNYSIEFYQNPNKFIVGIVADRAYHCSFATLIRQPLIDVDIDGSPLMISFDLESTSVRVYSRKVDDSVLNFNYRDQTIRDEETDSIWERLTGVAVDGPLKGKKLKADVGIISYANVWSEFHTNSEELVGNSIEP